jgi:hypothetical protein
MFVFESQGLVTSGWPFFCNLKFRRPLISFGGGPFIGKPIYLFPYSNR